MEIPGNIENIIHKFEETYQGAIRYWGKNTPGNSKISLNACLEDIYKKATHDKICDIRLYVLLNNSFSIWI